MKILLIMGVFLSVLQDSIIPWAMPASFDPGFSPPVIERHGAINAMALQSDGKLIVGGRFRWINGVGRTNIARLNPNGSLDNSFTPESIVNFVGTSVQLGALALDASDRIILGISAQYDYLYWPLRAPLVRFTTLGSIDPSFRTDGWEYPRTSSVYALNTLPNGNVLASVKGAGVLQFDPNTGRFLKTVASEAANVIRPDIDGSILFGGSSVVRYGADGIADTQFRPPVLRATNSAHVNALAIDVAGKIVVGGAFTSVNGVACGSFARLNRDGSRDDSFAANGTDGLVNAIAIQPDGRIVVAGNFSKFNGVNVTNIVRLLEDGVIDTSFQATVHSAVSSLLITPTSDLYVAGDFSAVNSTSRTGIAKYSLAGGGRLDAFSPRVISESTVELALLPDQRIVIFGDFSFVNGLPRKGVAVLMKNGEFDATFNCLTGSDGIVIGAVGGSQGKILIFGQFNSYEGHATRQIARVNPDGSADKSFISAVTFAYVSGIGIHTNGAILTAGYGSAETGEVSHLRLNPDGTLDTKFSLPVDPVRSLIPHAQVEADGKMVLGGKLVIGPNTANLARFNIDGSLDSMTPEINVFHLGRFNLVRDPGARFLLLPYVLPLEPSVIFRILMDGTVETGYRLPPLNFDGFELFSVSDWSIFVGGYTTIDGLIPLARFFPDGQRDANFVFPANARFVTALTETADGQILVGWRDNEFRAQVSRLMKLNPPPVRILSATAKENLFSLSFQTAGGVTYLVEYSDNLSTGEWMTLDSVNGKGTIQTTTSKVKDSSHRFYRVRSEP